MDHPYKRPMWKLHFGTVIALLGTSILLVTRWCCLGNSRFECSFETLVVFLLVSVGCIFELGYRVRDYALDRFEPPRPWLRFNLSTLVLLVLAAGAFMLLNMDVYERLGGRFLEDPLRIAIAAISALALVVIAILLQWGDTAAK
jgi:hypothetical protein